MTNYCNSRYEDYTKRKNWEWNSGIRDSITCLGLNPILGIKLNAVDEIWLLRDRGNFSAHLAQRYRKSIKEFGAMSDAEKKNINYSLKWKAETEETKQTIGYAAKYLKEIRQVYFNKFKQ